MPDEHQVICEQNANRLHRSLPKRRAECHEAPSGLTLHEIGRTVRVLQRTSGLCWRVLEVIGCGRSRSLHLPHVGATPLPGECSSKHRPTEPRGRGRRQAGEVAKKAPADTPFICPHPGSFRPLLGNLSAGCGRLPVMPQNDRLPMGRSLPQERCYWLRLVTLLPEVIARAAELGPGRSSHRASAGVVDASRRHQGTRT